MDSMRHDGERFDMVELIQECRSPCGFGHMFGLINQNGAWLPQLERVLKGQTQGGGVCGSPAGQWCPFHHRFAQERNGLVVINCVLDDWLSQEAQGPLVVIAPFEAIERTVDR